MIQDIVRFYSDAMHKNMSLCTLLPDQKVDHIFVLLHGYNESSGHVLDCARDALIRIVDEKNVMIILPNFDNGYYISKIGKDINLFFSKELRERFSTYNVDWSIGGISMGGYGACLIGSRNPFLYKNIFGIMPAFIQEDVYIGNPQIVGNGLDLNMVQYYKDTFGPISYLDRSLRANPVNTLSLLKILPHKPNLVFWCGTEDFLFIRNQKVMKILEKNSISYTFIPIPGHNHSYECVNIALEQIRELL